MTELPYETFLSQRHHMISIGGELISVAELHGRGTARSVTTIKATPHHLQYLIKACTKFMLGVTSILTSIKLQSEKHTIIAIQYTSRCMQNKLLGYAIKVCYCAVINSVGVHVLLCMCYLDITC